MIRTRPALGLLKGISELGLRLELRDGRLRVEPTTTEAVAKQLASHADELGELAASPVPGPVSTRALIDERDLPRFADVVTSAPVIGVSRVAGVLAVSPDGLHVEVLADDGAASARATALGWMDGVACLTWDASSLPTPRTHLDAKIVARVLEMAGDLYGCTGSLDALLAGLGRAPVITRPGAPNIAMPAYDARCLALVAEPLLARVSELGLERVTELEQTVARVLRAASDEGVRFDVAAWSALVEQAEGTLAVAEEHVRGRLGVGLGQDGELLCALQTHGYDLGSISDDELEAHDCNDATLQEIARGRAARTFLTNYGRPYARKLSDSAGGVLHPRFQQLGDTARITSADPNLIGLPGDRRIRRCIVPRPGHVFVRGDYATSQLRIAADYLRVTKLQQLFVDDVDVHTWTASKYLECEPSQVPRTKRAFGKAANFSLLFGVGVDGFREQSWRNYRVRLTEIEAVRLMDTFFDEYREIADWQENERKYPSPHVTTPLGRRLCLGRRGVTYNGRLAAPIQAIEADSLKHAMIWAHDELRGSGGRVMLPVYDALILEVPAHEGQRAAQMLEDVMIHAMSTFVTSVPIKVTTDCSISLDFG